MTNTETTNAAKTPEKPKDHLVWAVLSICFCFTFGLISLIYSLRVDKHYYAGRYKEAQNASRKARKWAIVAFAAIGIVYVMYFVLFIISCIAGTALLAFLASVASVLWFFN